MTFGLSQLPALSFALLAVVPLMAVELAKAARWRSLIGSARPPYRVCLQALVAGQLTNALSPLRAGEAVRIGVVAAQGGAVVPATGAMAGAKAIDTLSLAAIAAAVVGAASLESARWGLVGGAVVILGGAGLALCGGALRRGLEANVLTRKLHLTALVDVAETLRNWPTLLIVLSCTAVVWLAGLAANGIVLAATGIPPTPDLMARMLVAGYIVGLVPAPPARLGVFETGITVALTSAGVAPPQAIAAAVTLHLCQFAELGILLFVGFAARRLSGAVRRRALTERAST